ncbi:MAG: CRISPR-associated endonuclease Cas2 [Nitrospirota bacterium]
MTANYLVCYDITRPKRLRKVFKLMKGTGIHIQYSVFHCSLTWQQLLDLKERLKNIINPRFDDIRIYPLPSGNKVIVLGCGNRLPDGAEIFILPAAGR